LLPVSFFSFQFSYLQSSLMPEEAKPSLAEQKLASNDNKMLIKGFCFIYI